MLVTMESIYDLVKDYEEFITTPHQLLKTYKVGHVFDEEKSVKWNKEEIVRLNTLAMEDKKIRNDTVNAKLNTIVEEIERYIMQETGLSRENAHRMYQYLYEEHHSWGIREVISNLTDLIDLFNSLLKD